MFKGTRAVVALAATLCTTIALIGLSLVSSDLIGFQRLHRRPSYLSMWTDPLKSSDNRALASLVGAFMFRDGRHINWSPINVISVQWSHLDEFTQRLTLTDPSAEITFYTHYIPIRMQWQLREVYVNVVDAQGGHTSCHADFHHYFYDLERHPKLYRKDQPIDLQISCNGPRSAPTNLFITNLEFELDGNPEKIRKGDFSSRAQFLL